MCVEALKAFSATYVFVKGKIVSLQAVVPNAPFIHIQFHGRASKLVAHKSRDHATKVFDNGISSITKRQGNKKCIRLFWLHVFMALF